MVVDGEGRHVVEATHMEDAGPLQGLVGAREVRVEGAAW